MITNFYFQLRGTNFIPILLLIYYYNSKESASHPNINISDISFLLLSASPIVIRIHAISTFFSSLLFGVMSINLISITAETVGIFSVTSAHKGELHSLQMRMLNQFEFVIDAWYVVCTIFTKVLLFPGEKLNCFWGNRI